MLGPKRAPAVPDVPTIVEAGLPDVQGITFNGLFAPKGDAARRGRQAQRRHPRGAGEERPSSTSSPSSAPRRAAARRQEFTGFLAGETAKWTDVMQKANIKVPE